jgi:two-component system response regulator PilR (NtrC family)
MPRLDGVSLLAGLREKGMSTPVIMITAFAASDSAIQAMKQGAFDYITKPFKVEEIKLVVRRALEEAQQRRPGEETAARAVEEPALREIIGRSTKMVELYKLISRVALVDSSVLITGESGTGKELVARTIHYNSGRSGKPFVAINCGAIPEELLESELFGHVKGSFTGAISNKVGLMEAANGGTAFLDEVAEMSPGLQVKLLRFLQDHTFRRVGGTEDLAVDLRIIAATNKNLADLIRTAAFREDLYYRLNVITVDVPPLRERHGDIPLLAATFLGLFAARAGRTAMRIAPDAMQLLTQYPWPGNVRELENVMERAVALAASEELGVENLPPVVRAPVVPACPQAQIPAGGVNLEQVLADLEQALMREALARADGVQTRAAKLLGLNFRSFRYRAKKYGLERPEHPQAHADG